MDQDALPFIIIAAFAINCLIMYFIIKAGVRAGNAEVERLLRIKANLEIEKMKKDGFTSEEIATILNRG